MVNIPINYSIRLAIVKSVGETYIDFQLIDQFSDQTFRAPKPHPYAGRGGGIFAGIEKDTIIMVSSGIGEKWYCIGVVPDHNFYFDLDGASDIRYNETSYPSVKEGEIIIKGNTGQYIDLTQSGNIKIDAGLGNSSADIELSNNTNTMFTRIGHNYSFNESGRNIDGIIMRDLRDEESSSYANVTNFLDGEEYNSVLSEIGRLPGKNVQNRTTNLIKRTIRNPPLVEKRSLVYEYANSYNVQSFDKEIRASNDVAPVGDNASDIENLKTDPSFRKNRRTDVLNLNSLNFNHLIEKIEGTVVDIYGNPLDINRNVITIPDIEDSENSSGDGNDGLKNIIDKKRLKNIYDYHRRSVKFHYEINSRKDIAESEPSDLDKVKNNGRNFGKWSIDVDGEGLTKINIPSTSETGNIPVLGRYFNSRDPNEESYESGSFKDGEKIDIRLQQFGSPGENGKDFSGILIKNKDYLPRKNNNNSGKEDVITLAGTAFHDITNVANSLLTIGKFKNDDGTTSPVKTEVNNKISIIGDKVEEEPNAGGRSLHANLDGSMEMSIGADTIDRKSLVLDTAGGAIIHLGRDRNGRSITQQADGDVIIEIGGPGINNDTRFTSETDTEDRPGRLEIHLNRPGGTPQKIIIDENGVTFDIQQGIYFKSTGNIVFDSNANILLNAEQILHYGSGDIENRSISGSESKVRRKGRGNG